MSESVDVVAIRRAVKDYVESQDDETAEKERLINEVAAETDHPTEVVRYELKEIEREGFCYMVDSDGETTVKLP